MSKCVFFGKCGGCLYQDMEQTQYVQKKENFVKKSFSDYHLHIDIEKTICIPFGRRRRATFAFRKGIIGFNGYKSHQIVPLDSCPALVPELSEFLPHLKILVQNLKGSGDISVLSTPYGIDIHIKRESNPPSLHQREILAQFASTHNIARIMYNHEPIVQSVQLPFAPDSFLQPSQEGEEILINLVCNAIQDKKNVVDLFCGSGTFTKPLFKKGKNIIGYDIASDSLKALGHIGQERDLFRNPLLPEELKNIDAVVIDPPRAGALLQCKQLSKTNIPLIAMVSCNPSTAARDIRELIDNGGYKLHTIVLIDQFIYSNHIEIFCTLTK
ncbi:MAG: class I SAM-dependent RNA methyltransferase [Alphaproteobacteria bacterium]|nr:class I SAM-dependent RNA methyltransferase [Alphaproteobacteria bacterium]